MCCTVDSDADPRAAFLGDEESPNEQLLRRLDSLSPPLA
jgi:hypothetical protein